MSKYDFTLRFTLPANERDMDAIADCLYGGGCDDALIGIGRAGGIALDFTREATSAQEAVLSAIADVSAAIPGSELVEVTPDLVGVTDVAELVGCSRQNIRQLMLSCGSPVPVPAHEGKRSLWHLASVLDWLVRQKQYEIPTELIELASTAMRVNVATDALRADPDTQDQLRAVFA